ncbi:MAG: biopolymer transporter ExbD [Myxococcales bacterium]|nr:biopolymer transporter ExbD [Myxococcales bacterium]HRC55738.1 biopolymer transporter ExbD [Kofleriaceae bacterium]
MGAAVGTEGGGGRNVNVDLNIVPFIDLLSCLTAFLLVSAVWVNIAQINIQPKGKSRDAPPVTEVDPPVQLSVLLSADKIWLGLSRVGDYQEIAKNAEGKHDWVKFENTLKDHKASAYFTDRGEMELAAESIPGSEVKYQDLIQAMDIAIKVGFNDVGLSDPGGLTVRPN